MVYPFPDYDVLSKRGSLSWNSQTRAVIDERLAMREAVEALGDAELETLHVLVAHVAPEPEGRPPTNTVALLLQKIADNGGDGYRPAAMPQTQAAWRLALAGLEAEARARWSAPFAQLTGERIDMLLNDMRDGRALSTGWAGVDPALLWAWRVLPDIVSAHWAHPSAWSAMGFGGPASPRGYVRLAADRRDPWEAEEKREAPDAR